jgi:hypothetical protein
MDLMISERRGLAHEASRSEGLESGYVDKAFAGDFTKSLDILAAGHRQGNGFADLLQQKFGRQRRKVIGGGHDKHLLALCLDSCQKSSKQGHLQFPGGGPKQREDPVLFHGFHHYDRMKGENQGFDVVNTDSKTHCLEASGAVGEKPLTVDMIIQLKDAEVFASLV